MSIQTTMQTDMITAMKARDSQKKETLAFLVSELKKLAKDSKTDVLTDEDSVRVLRKQLKQRKETLDSSLQAGRGDLAAQAQYESDVISAYLPTSMCAEQMQVLAEKTIRELGASTMKDMGKVLAAIAKDAPGVDKSVLSGIVKNLLGK